MAAMRDLETYWGSLRVASHKAVIPAPLERLEVRAVHQPDVRGVAGNLDFDDFAPLALLEIPVVEVDGVAAPLGEFSTTLETAATFIREKSRAAGGIAQLVRAVDS